MPNIQESKSLNWENILRRVKNVAQDSEKLRKEEQNLWNTLKGKKVYIAELNFGDDSFDYKTSHSFRVEISGWGILRRGAAVYEYHDEKEEQGEKKVVTQKVEISSRRIPMSQEAEVSTFDLEPDAYAVQSKISIEENSVRNDTQNRFVTEYYFNRKGIFIGIRMFFINNTNGRFNLDSAEVDERRLEALKKLPFNPATANHRARITLFAFIKNFSDSGTQTQPINLLRSVPRRG